MTESSLCQVFRIREDGMYGWADTPLARSLDALGREDCLRAQLAMPADAPAETLLNMLDEALAYAKAPWIQIASEGLETTLGLYAALARITDDAARLPLAFASATGEGMDLPDAAAAPLGEHLAMLFSRLAWRKEALAAFLARVRAGGTPDREALGRMLDAAANAATPLDTPPLRCVVRPRGDALFREGEALLRQNDPARAAATLNAAKRLGCGRHTAIAYGKALAKAGLGRLSEVRAHAAAAIAGEDMAPAAWTLLRVIMPYLPFGEDSYPSVRTAVESVEGYLVSGQEAFLHNLVLALPNNARILEVGGYLGRSTTAMAFACVGTERRIVTVDTFFGNDGPMGRSDSFLDVWKANLADFDLERFVTPRPGWAHEVLRQADAPRDFDFAFIDGSHEYADVLRDFEIIHPLVKPGGYIALHDVEPGWPGPWRVWRQAAAPSLVDHAVVSTLACGRKPVDQNGGPTYRPWLGYGLEWIDHLAEAHPELAGLCAAMRACVAAFAEHGAATTLDRQAMAAVAAMPRSLRTAMRQMLDKEGGEDPALHFLNALCRKQEGRFDEAALAFKAAYGARS